jgi:apolipoprotein N-acyltransferase
LAINSNPRDVTDRHLAATALLNKDQGLDLVVWPENAIDVDDFTTSSARSVLTQEAIRIDAPIAVGVTEDAGRAFTNAQILLSTSGDEASRYDKVRRVPYGEYIPLRSLLASLGAPVDRIPRDAAAGTERAVLTMPHNGQNVPLAVAISWEVFFSDRVNDGVSMGGQLVINPTNGSSYTGEILQQQQVATSQLRALESGRYLVQAATTGYTVFIDHKGHVLQRIPVGEQAVIFADVPLRTGRTLFSHTGTWPVVLALFVVIGVLVRRARSPHSLRSSRVAP